jgi:4-phosphopantoate--beta-alanine ligase
MVREKLYQGWKKGLVHETGLIAHGRGEAFDYLLGEKTIPMAEEAARVSAAALLIAKNPVISVNGNVAALNTENCVNLARSIPANLEVNLFHRSEQRIRRIMNELRVAGADKIYGSKGDARIPGLDHSRGVCDREGIFSADVVLVPLEDGDRCEALRKMGKMVVVVDLNPISRTARTANITIVDNVVRALPNIEKWVEQLKQDDKKKLKQITSSWDNTKKLGNVVAFIAKRLKENPFEG